MLLLLSRGMSPALRRPAPFCTRRFCIFDLATVRPFARARFIAAVFRLTDAFLLLRRAVVLLVFVFFDARRFPAEPRCIRDFA